MVSLQRATNSKALRKPKAQHHVEQGNTITPDTQDHLCRILSLCSHVHSCLADAAAGSMQCPNIGQVKPPGFMLSHVYQVNHLDLHTFVILVIHSFMT